MVSRERQVQASGVYKGAMTSESHLQQQPLQRQDKQHHHVEDMQPPVVRQPPINSLTLNEILDTAFEPDKTFSSVNRDEFFTNIWTQERHASSVASAAITIVGPSTEQHHHHQRGSLTTPVSQSYKTIDQVWRDIQHSQLHQPHNHHECQSSYMPPRCTTGEPTFQDFLVKAAAEEESIPPAHLPPPPPPTPLEQLQQLQIPEFQMTRENNIPSLATPDALGEPATEAAMALTPTMVAPTPMPAVGNRRKRLAEMTIERMMERIHRRTIKNRESAARSRARKQAYTVELQMEHTQLREENAKLREEKQMMKQKLVEAIDERAREDAKKIRGSHRRCISCSW